MGHGTILSTDHHESKERSRLKTVCTRQLSAPFNMPPAPAWPATPDGYWCFELEADCTIPAEYILMMHYMAEVDDQLKKTCPYYAPAKERTAVGLSTTVVR
jgi:hypothetical protein